MNILLGLAPFVAFALLTHLTGVAIALWAAALIAVALTVRSRLRTRGGVKLLEAGAAALFAALACVATFLRPAWSVFEIRVLVDLGLVAIAGGSILIGRPFTLQYAREHVPPSRQAHPIFMTVNRTISAVWAAAFVVEAITSACIA